MSPTNDDFKTLSPKLVKWRNFTHPKTNKLEKETACWIITDVKIGYYDESDITKVKFSRQYIYENSTELGYLFWMPPKRGESSLLFLIGFESPDNSSVMMHSQRVESDLHIYTDRFSGTYLKCTDFEISIQGKIIRLVWKDNGYAEESS